MINFENLEIDKRVLYSSGHFSGDYNQELYLKKTASDNTGRSRFYIGVFANIDGRLAQQGFIYFYLDHKTKISSFIGVSVEKDYRSLGIASFLVAVWIDFCFNNGYDFLGVNPRQRKPFLLYLLKTYGFEIFDRSLYSNRDDVITICQSLNADDKRKLLAFKDPNHEKIFMGSKIYKNDNYAIIHDYKGVRTLDQVIVPLQNQSKNFVEYDLYDYDQAITKTEMTLSRHRR